VGATPAVGPSMGLAPSRPCPWLGGVPQQTPKNPAKNAKGTTGWNPLRPMALNLEGVVMNTPVGPITCAENAIAKHGPGGWLAERQFRVFARRRAFSALVPKGDPFAGVADRKPRRPLLRHGCGTSPGGLTRCSRGPSCSSLGEALAAVLDQLELPLGARCLARMEATGIRIRPSPYLGRPERRTGRRFSPASRPVPAKSAGVEFQPGLTQNNWAELPVRPLGLGAQKKSRKNKNGLEHRRGPCSKKPRPITRWCAGAGAPQP